MATFNPAELSKDVDNLNSVGGKLFSSLEAAIEVRDVNGNDR